MYLQNVAWFPKVFALAIEYLLAVMMTKTNGSCSMGNSKHFFEKNCGLSEILKKATST